MGFRVAINKFLKSQLVLALPLLLLIVAPISALLFFGLRLGAAAFFSPSALDALRLSVISTLLTVLLAMVFGTPLALFLARTKIAWLEALVDLPTLLPPVVAGLGLLLAFGQSGLGKYFSLLGLHLPFSFAAVVMAQLFVAAPYFVRSAKAGFVAVGEDIQDAARGDGANEAQVFWQVVLPASSSALLDGGLMCWARALGEFGATAVFAGSLMGRTRTMPLAIYGQFEQDFNTSLALASVMALFAFGLMAVLRHLRRVHS